MSQRDPADGRHFRPQRPSGTMVAPGGRMADSTSGIATKVGGPRLRCPLCGSDADLRGG
ncbi:MAG TPA: hypothetical protein VLT32_00280 [Candidatus Sulfomarinibacteraceae bacterium]|nr:hypothetical protein [Candidatus Sulfomarinibacteraceae bacterium]